MCLAYVASVSPKLKAGLRDMPKLFAWHNRSFQAQEVKVKYITSNITCLI